MARDVANVLGYADANAAVARHCKAVTTCSDVSSGQVRHVQIIPERDVYRLVMRSKLPGAEAFEEWVVGTVLPSIRKSGSYGAPAQATADLSDPASLRTLLLGYTEKVLELEATVAEQAPKVEVHDRTGTPAHGDIGCCTGGAAPAEMPIKFWSEVFLPVRSRRFGCLSFEGNEPDLPRSRVAQPQ
ncbi:BRO family, N-terminal domain protein [Ralstonia insidiosa]|uniref:BRO family, N-terminal domain protein n=1 Tax=Ralstonia insidiosa TaxID=190721 RepID=A0AAC9BHS1_9RALS|nr:BRO family, N-terminal domain protein [Ralstonia insidiosa]